MTHSILRWSLFLPLTFAAVAVPARADFLDGRAVNSLGQGVAGIDIDLRNSGGGGGNINISNDSTDANGFFHVTVPAGTFRVIFNPPQPPASTDLLTEVDPVTVAGTANMGTVVLTPGKSISGRLLNPSSVGISGVNIDVLDAAGNLVTLLYDFTDAAGNFSFASPTGAIELRFDTTTVVGGPWAPKALSLNLSSNTALGNITLPQGFVLSAIVRGPGAVAVNNCDLDVFDASHVKLYTPSDNTNASGFVDTIVPAGSWTFEFCPPFANHLVAGRVGPQTISATTSLGIIQLATGVVLSGNVKSYLNVNVINADVDVAQSVGGADVLLCDDNTDAAGNYAVIVPSGTFTVRFTQPPGSVLGSDFHYSTSVAGNTVVNGILPLRFTGYCFGDGSLATPCPCSAPDIVPNPSGAPDAGCANSFNMNGAKLTAAGTTAPDTVKFTADIANGYLGFAFLVKGNASVASGMIGGDGVRCADGALVRFGAHNAGTNGAAVGSWTFPNPVQTTAVSAATLQGAGDAYYQLFYRNTGAGFCSPATSNFSNGVHVTW